MSSAPITARQLELLSLVVEHLREHQRPPTFRWLMDRMGVRATNTIHDHLARLERKGLVELDGGVARGIRVTPRGLAQVGGCCPFCGLARESASSYDATGSARGRVGVGVLRDAEVVEVNDATS